MAVLTGPSQGESLATHPSRKDRGTGWGNLSVGKSEKGRSRPPGSDVGGTRLTSQVGKVKVPTSRSQTPRTNSSTVISGRAPSRMGGPVVPMPRLT